MLKENPFDSILFTYVVAWSWSASASHLSSLTHQFDIKAFSAVLNPWSLEDAAQLCLQP